MGGGRWSETEGARRTGELGEGRALEKEESRERHTGSRTKGFVSGKGKRGWVRDLWAAAWAAGGLAHRARVRAALCCDACKRMINTSASARSRSSLLWLTRPPSRGGQRVWADSESRRAGRLVFLRSGRRRRRCHPPFTPHEGASISPGMQVTAAAMSGWRLEGHRLLGY